METSPGTPTVNGVFDYTWPGYRPIWSDGQHGRCYNKEPTAGRRLSLRPDRVPFVDQLQPSGGVGPFTFVLTGGALPDGLTLDGTTGKMHPAHRQVPGPFSFSFQVTDKHSSDRERDMLDTRRQAGRLRSPGISTIYAGASGALSDPQRLRA